MLNWRWQVRCGVIRNMFQKPVRVAAVTLCIVTGLVIELLMLVTGCQKMGINRLISKCQWVDIGSKRTVRTVPVRSVGVWRAGSCAVLLFSPRHSTLVIYCSQSLFKNRGTCCRPSGPSHAQSVGLFARLRWHCAQEVAKRQYFGAPGDWDVIMRTAGAPLRWPYSCSAHSRGPSVGLTTQLHQDALRSVNLTKQT
jgi:hypothetical protein